MWFLFFILNGISTFLPGKEVTYPIQTTDSVKNQLVAYPVVYFLPETRWGFGFAGLYNFRFKGEPPASNPSLIQFTASYTQRKQILLTIPVELYWNNNTWKLKGEFSYFRYLYNFY